MYSKAPVMDAGHIRQTIRQNRPPETLAFLQFARTSCWEVDSGQLTRRFFPIAYLATNSQIKRRKDCMQEAPRKSPPSTLSLPVRSENSPGVRIRIRQ